MAEVVPANKSYRLRQFIFTWGISAPGLVSQIIFGWLPLLIGIVVSFQSFHFQRSTWAGLKNYEDVVKDPLSAPFSATAVKENYRSSVDEHFQTSLKPPTAPLKAWIAVRSLYYGIGLIWRNTFYYAFLSIGLTFFIPIIVSIMLLEMPKWLVRIMMLLWFLPIADMASTILVKYFYNVDYGLLNGLLVKYYDFLGKPAAERVFPRWLNSPELAMLCIVLPQIVMFTPGLVYIASLQSIPQDLYDAAEIDGCNFFQKVWHVTLPRLRPVIATMLVFALISAFQVFGEILIMTEGGPSNATITVSYYVYKLSFDYLEVGKGNALAVVFFVFLMILTAIQRMVVKEDVDRGASRKTLKLMKKDA